MANLFLMYVKTILETVEINIDCRLEDLYISNNKKKLTCDPQVKGSPSLV